MSKKFQLVISPNEPVEVQLTFQNGSSRPVILKGNLYPQAQREKNGVRLTPRERQVVQLLAEGKTNKEVASTLDISVKTAETHRTNIMRKLKTRSMSELVRYAIRHRIVEA